MNYFAIDNKTNDNKNNNILNKNLDIHFDDFLSDTIKANSFAESVNNILPVVTANGCGCLHCKICMSGISEISRTDGVAANSIHKPESIHNTLHYPVTTICSPTTNTFNILLNTIKSDRIGLVRNHMKEAIDNNDPIEPNLHVIAVISNICQFKKRYYLMKDFIKRMEFEKNVILYIVELAYGNQEYGITSSKNPRHLQLRTDTAIWHKENMINLGVQRLLPSDWKAFAWIDGDVEFENINWASDTLKILNGSRDIVQLFSHALDMDASFNVLNIFNSFSHQYEKNLNYSYKAPNYWHPGYAWACTRKAYEKMGGLFEYGILGSSDYVMACCIMNRGLSSVSPQYSNEFKKKVYEYECKVNHLRLGYVPGVIRHFFHGSKINRKYVERNTILFKHNYDPIVHLVKNKNGILTGSKNFSAEFKQDIYNYFSERNEDE